MVRAGFNNADFHSTSPFEFYGLMNFMKIGVVYADLLTTVSPTYAREIQESYEFGYGLEGLLRERSQTSDSEFSTESIIRRGIRQRIR